MLISNNTIRTIHVVAQHLSFAQAAEELNKVASAISYTVRQLEETLGTPLFDRKGRQLSLTPAGEYFLNYSKNILNDLDTLKRNTLLASQDTPSKFSVAINNIIPPMAIVEFIHQFELTFPQIHLLVKTEVYNGCWEALYHHNADFVIGAPHFVPYTDRIYSGKIGQVRWDFLVGKNHPLAKKQMVLSNYELRQYPAICIQDTAIKFTPQQAWLLEGQKPIFVPDYAIAMELIKQNVGIGYLAQHQCQELIKSGELIKKEHLESKHSTPIFFAYHSDQSSKVHEWCSQYLSKESTKALWCSEGNY